MKPLFASLAALAALVPAAPALAEVSDQFRNGDERSRAELPPYLQCVPYARELSGIQIYGDAHTWWGQAEGRYERGNTPRVGAVMAFVPHRNMQLGHVAAVSKVIDSRTVLLDHANWSPINGRRGQIERDVKAIDVSPNNDWSEVRVWYDPVQGLGTTAWPVHGFIYGEKAQIARPRLARGIAERAAPRATPPARQTTSKEFTEAFASLGRTELRPRPLQATEQRRRAETPRAAPRAKPVDPLDAVVLRYGS
ncbi:CHAP domain-containing protein [Erythrobacter sp. HKB08]|uniref:CHAP domain-containing protein n=1 Tax=Erythrobacter sp. HKB08 TaxID=2502843 RepID=UPI0010093AFB|nr:CHAP domain-containing protein [Erythrobacter sp. HKB08]